MTEYHQFLQGDFVPFQEFLEDWYVIMKMIPGSEEARTGRAHSSSMQQDGTAITARQGGILTWTVHIVNAIIRPTLTKKGRDNTLRLPSASIVFLMIITGCDGSWMSGCVGLYCLLFGCSCSSDSSAAMAECDYE